MSLYLKYRPQDFSSMMGQKFVKETLKKAISEDKTVWAYLLCGPRWTWKTTTARILAKWINCENSKDWNPCLECDICKDFALERLVDIIEIDAASNTWVDNIREIIERAQYSPTRTKYKVYIIDEVHMLSKWAFNALLKILEEPPKHVKFILATTEVHKIPETILSRCQRYDFKRISNEEVSERLKFIASEEWVTAEDKALGYIASVSDWALRNAISLFEQYIISGEVKYDNIAENLWIVSEDILSKLLELLLNKDKEAINLFDELYNSGKNPRLLVKDLLMFSKDKLFEVAWTPNASNLITVIEELNKAYISSKNSFDEKTSFIVAFVKIVSPKVVEEVTVVKKEVAFTAPKAPTPSAPQYEAPPMPDFNDAPTVPSTPPPPPVSNEPAGISMDDVADVFGWFDDAPKSAPVSVAPPKTSGDVGVSSGEFNFERLISAIKAKPGKAFVVISLKNSIHRFDNGALIIMPKNEAMFKKLNNPETKDFIKSTLEEIGYDFPLELRF